MRYKLFRAATTTIFRLNQKAQLNFVRYNYNGVILSQLRGGDSSNNILGHSNKHKNNIHPKHQSMSTDITIADDDTWTIREEDNGEAFSSLSHVGYSLHSDPVHKTGGWLAHRVTLRQAQQSTDSHNTNTGSENIDLPPCWIQDEVATKLTKFNYSEMPIGRAPRILVLYGSLRPTSFSRKLAYEFARLLETLGCDVRTYNPSGLPVRDPSLENEKKVKELRSLTLWSDGHVWVSPGKK